LSNLFVYLKKKHGWFHRRPVYQPPRVYSPYIKRKIVPNIRKIKVDGAKEKAEGAKKAGEVDESITRIELQTETIVHMEDEG
ncbi:hypothetical protein PFISCL1PPCAC_18092, partial [Pristionchus fissidentatus]